MRPTRDEPFDNIRDDNIRDDNVRDGDVRDDGGPGEPATVGGRRRRERGQLALENLVMLPLVLFVSLAAWQAVAIGLTFVLSGNASRAAAREYSITGSQTRAEAAARDRSPWVFDDLTVSVSGDEVTVRMRVPAAGPAALGFPQTLSTTRTAVDER